MPPSPGRRQGEDVAEGHIPLPSTPWSPPATFLPWAKPLDTPVGGRSTWLGWYLWTLVKAELEETTQARGPSFDGRVKCWPPLPDTGCGLWKSFSGVLCSGSLAWPLLSHPVPTLLLEAHWQLAAASYSGDFFEFLWGWLLLGQHLWKKKIARWKLLVIESVFLFWMGKPELGEMGINYSVAEFCCRKWMSNLLQKA